MIAGGSSADTKVALMIVICHENDIPSFQFLVNKVTLSKPPTYAQLRLVT